MAELNRDEFFSRIHDIIGTDTSEQAIAFVEDMTDTYNGMERRAQQDEDWEQKYHDLDEAWKEKYRHRFFTAGADTGAGNPSQKTDPEEDEYDPEDVSVNDLFTNKS